MFKKNWFGTWNLKTSSKQIHSLDNLKTLHNVLFKNQVVSEQNKHLLVETLRSIAEILIWGDQNDSTVFDFFLEKNMLSFFLKIMKQKCGSYVCVQLLQTLNILFENIRDETSLYYLLSNNHVNSIIVHKFDFSDEEVMAYYISFLKTLSFKLNDHTIHFFFNEHTNDFPLYTEAIKFFNHSEKMVRIAVRTLTLNVFKVEEKSMLKFVGDHTAVPYFSNLVWFIGNHVLEIDNCLKKSIKDQQTLIKLDDLVAEHLDHLHYLNDILLLSINDLNEILTEHLLNRMLIPLYIYSLIAPSSSDIEKQSQISENSVHTLTTINYSHTISNNISDPLKERPRISRIVSLFLLSQVFLIISYDSLVQKLVEIILNGNFRIFEKPLFIAPSETLEESLINNLLNKSLSGKSVYEEDHQMGISEDEKKNTESIKFNKCPNDIRLSQNINKKIPSHFENSGSNSLLENDVCFKNFHEPNNDQINSLFVEEFFKDKPFLEALYKSFDCANQQDDHLAIFSLSLLYAIIFNAGIKKCHFQKIVSNKETQSIINQLVSNKLIDHITQIISMSGNFDSFIRPITLELCALLLLKLCIKEEGSILSDHHLAIIEQTKENSTSVVRNYFRNENENLFLDLFEDEFLEYSKFKINVEYLLMDANLLIPPRQLAPLMLNNLHFTRRLPYSDIEKARYALRVFFLIRNLSMKISNEIDNQLPLTNVKKLIAINDSIDLNNCHLVHCFLQLKNQVKEEGYIVILDEQLVFIEPDKKIGTVNAKYTANLQNIDVCLDKDDSRSLLLTIRPNAANGSQSKFGPSDLSSSRTCLSKHSNTNVKLLFDDYIRCKVTEQHISKGKSNVIQRKLKKIADLIDIQLDAIPNQYSNGILTTNQQNLKNRNYHLLKSNLNNGNRNLKYSHSLYHPQSGLAIPGGAIMLELEKNGSGGKKHHKSSNNNNILTTGESNTSLSTNLVPIKMATSKLPNVFGKKSVNSKPVNSISSCSSHRNSNKNSRTNSRDNSPKPYEQIIQEIPMNHLNSPKNQRKKLENKSNLDLQNDSFIVEKQFNPDKSQTDEIKINDE